MAWQKESAAVGLAGLSPREAALGALCCEQFQMMPDPLAGVKKEDMFMLPVDPDANKSWYELGQSVGLDVVSDEDEELEQEEEEEDKEVARIYNESKDIQRKLLKAVRTVAAGYRMVTEGWTLFEKTCEEVGPGELPQLLRQLKSATTPSPGPSTPVKTEPMEEEEVQQPEGAEPEASASGFIETPIMIKLGPHMYIYKCGNCDIPPKTKRAMDAHIRSAHTKKALLCSFCHFTTYNMDSLQRHEKEHK